MSASISMVFQNTSSETWKKEFAGQPPFPQHLQRAAAPPRPENKRDQCLSARSLRKPAQAPSCASISLLQTEREQLNAGYPLAFFALSAPCSGICGFSACNTSIFCRNDARLHIRFRRFRFPSRLTGGTLRIDAFRCPGEPHVRAEHKGALPYGCFTPPLDFSHRVSVSSRRIFLTFAIDGRAVNTALSSAFAS